MEKLAVVEPFLKGKKRNSVRRFLGVPPPQTKDSHKNEDAISMLQRMPDAQRVNTCRAIEDESNPETEREDEDIHAITAKLLFGVTERYQMVGSQNVGNSTSRRRTDLDLASPPR